MVLIDHDKCVGCGMCVADCSVRNMVITDKKAVVKRDCFLCGHCVAICPVGAVSIPEYDMEDVETYEEDRFEVDPDALLRAIKFRRSIRRFRKEAVGERELNQLLQTGRYTATAKNNQNCCFVFVQDSVEELKARIWASIDALEASPAAENPGFRDYFRFNARRKADPEDDYLFRNAPVVLYITSDWPLDAGLAAQNIETMAAALGMGALFNGYLARITDGDEETKKWLGIEGKTIKACMLLGYPARCYARTAPRAAANVIWK